MTVKRSKEKTYRRGGNARVICRRVRSESIREIAAPVAPNTNGYFYSIQDARKAAARSRSVIIDRSYQLAERLVQLGLGETKKGDRKAIVDALEGTGVLISKLVKDDMPVEQVQDHTNAKVEFYGKSDRWPTNEELSEFEKTLPVELLIKGELE